MVERYYHFDDTSVEQYVRHFRITITMEGSSTMNLENASIKEKFLFSIPTATEAEFKSSMIDMIKHNFADILSSEDIELLGQGNAGLDKIAEKFHAKYEERFAKLKKILQ